MAIDEQPADRILKAMVSNARRMQASTGMLLQKTKLNKRTLRKRFTKLFLHFMKSNLHFSFNVVFCWFCFAAKLQRDFAESTKPRVIGATDGIQQEMDKFLHNDRR